MSHISNLLKNSRIAQVSRSEQPLFSVKNATRPSHQVIETKPALLHRQEWGLKASIPSKVKTRYIVVKDLDNQHRLTSFEPMGQYQWNRLRFQEMGLAPRYSEDVSNPLFEGETKRSGKHSMFSNAINLPNDTPLAEKTRKINQIKKYRPEFNQWLLENHPQALAGGKSVNGKSVNDLAIEFLHEKMGKLDINTAAKAKWNIVGSGGLTYNLQGRLKQSPKGVKHKAVAPGRLLSVQGPDRAVAVGGFVAEAKSVGRNPRALQYNMGDFVRTEVFPFIVEDPKVENGNITLSAALVEPKNDYNFAQKIGLPNNKTRYYSDRNNGNQSQRKTIRSMTPEESRSQSEEFLNLLKTTM